MSLDETALARQLRMLRKGRGLWAHDLRARLAGGLAEVCGISHGDDISTARQRVRSTILDLLTGAAEGPRTAILAALAIETDTSFTTLTARRDLLAGTLFWNERTVRRMEERGIALIVAAAASRLATGASEPAGMRPDWYVRSFRALLRLDTEAPVLFEERTIVANRSGLGEIVASVSLPRPAVPLPGPGVRIEVLYGVHANAIYSSAQHYRFALRLPHPLAFGVAHSYGIAIHLAGGQPMSPHYAFQPVIPCEEFDLRVRFDPARPVHAVWRLDGAPPRLVEDREPTADRLWPDDVGEVRVQFSGLVPGLGYGLAWLRD